MKNFTTKFLSPFIAALTLSSAAYADDYSYDHNGSKMRVNVEKQSIRIYYDQPRAGLSRVGVRAGTLLFDGSINDGYIEGMSRIFNSNCGEVDYFVYGDFTPGRDFMLNGAAPVLSNTSCRIVDNVYTGSNANLLFVSLGFNPDPRPKPNPSPQVVGRGCVTGVNTSLNVRVGPGANYGRAFEIPANTCGIKVNENCRDGWCYIEAGRISGWTSMRYIKR